MVFNKRFRKGLYISYNLYYNEELDVEVLVMKELKKLLKKKFYEMHIDEVEDICEEYATVEFVKELIESVEKALNEAKAIPAYRTPVIEDRDNGGDSDGNLEIVEFDELKFKEEATDEDYLHYYIFSRGDVVEVNVLKIETDDYNAYLVLRKIVEDEKLDYCGMSCVNTLYILV